MKTYKLSKDKIAPLVLGMGGCLATDSITVEGHPVGYMYREKPKNPTDSGWRFFSGFEDDAYMANKDNHAVYDVNTIANYDPSIIPYLSASVGKAFERSDTSSAFNEIAE